MTCCKSHSLQLVTKLSWTNQSKSCLISWPPSSRVSPYISHDYRWQKTARGQLEFASDTQTQAEAEEEDKVRGRYLIWAGKAIAVSLPTSSTGNKGLSHHSTSSCSSDHYTYSSYLWVWSRVSVQESERDLSYLGTADPENDTRHPLPWALVTEGLL
jgi:hypothetical protein